MTGQSEKFEWEEPEPLKEPETALQIAMADDAGNSPLTPAPPGDNGETSPPGLGRLVGEMVIRFYEDDGLDVQFPNLGLITVGRLERSIPFLYNRLHLARQMDFRRREGLPEQFAINQSDT